MRSLPFNSKVITLFAQLFIVRNLAEIQNREICCYSISCKEKENIGKPFSYFLILVLILRDDKRANLFWLGKM